MVRLGTLLVALAVLAVAWPARAQDATAVPARRKGPPRLVFSTPPGCGNEATFRHTLALFLDAADPFDPNAPDVVRVTFTKIPGGYRGAVQYTPPNGEPWPTEEKLGPLCQLIYLSVARLASRHVPDPPPKAPEPAPATPELTKQPPDPPPFRTLSSWAPPPMPPENLRRPDPSPPPSPPGHKVDLAIGLSGFVLMSAGYTANVGLGFQLGAELRSAKDESDIFRLGLEIRGLVPGIAYARDRLDPKVLDTIPQELDVSQLSTQLVPCVRWKYLLGCGVAQLNVVFMQNKGGMVSDWAFGFGPRLGLEVPFAERFAVRAFGEALVTARVAGVDYGIPPPGDDGSPNVVWRQSVVSGFFGVGLSVTFQ